MRKTVVALVSLFLINGPVFAQTTKSADEVKKPKKIEKAKSGTYLKMELIHGDFSLYDFDYYFNDFGLEIENHWARRHVGLSGFSVGYRKEDFSSASYGHFLNSKVFWKAEKHGFYFKPGIGAEWGKSSPRFEQTHFRYNGVELISYKRIYLERNAWMPIGVKNTGTLSHFFELSIGQKSGPFLFEGGTRIGYDKFVINTFQFKNGDLILQDLSGQHKFVPTLYIEIGVRLF